MLKVAIVVGGKLSELLYADAWDEAESIGYAAKAVHASCVGPGLNVWVSDGSDAFRCIDDRERVMNEVESADVIAEIIRRIDAL